MAPLHFLLVLLDPFYIIGATTENHCHQYPIQTRRKYKGGTDQLSGKYGAPLSDCDAPWSLVNETFKTIERDWKDKIDFVVWTGDNARHDNDENFPRSPSQIADLNEQIADMFYQVFKTDDPIKPLSIPIIPSLGNNDIFPHNIIAAGPNPTTRRFAKIWRPFYPESQFHEVEHGVYFTNEVIPNKLAVISLNTIYWFDNNGAVDGCDWPEEPGFQQFEWLQNQLYQYRDRGVKVWLTGHVAPRKGSYSPSCWKKYDIWTKQFRDVIIGSVFGHSNVDFFIFLHEKETTMKGGAEGWLKKIKEQCQKFAKKHKNINDEQWAIANVVPSVIPNYYPGFRILEYETKGLKHQDENSEQTRLSTSRHALVVQGPDSFKTNADVEGMDETTYIQEFLSITNSSLSILSENEIEGLFKKKRTKKRNRLVRHQSKSRPDDPPKGQSRGPAYDYQALTPIRYTQYYANLTEINAGGKFKYEPLYATDKTPYNMKDLTVSSYIELARRIGVDIGSTKEIKTAKKNSLTLWRTFLQRAFVGTNVDNDLDL